MKYFIGTLVALFCMGAAALCNCADSTDNGSPKTTPKPIIFEGAEGFGVESYGGSGGLQLRVTNLHDSGPGSLRSALSRQGPRAIIFDVGGIIHLESRITITDPYVSILGQTAPSPGITLRNHGMLISSHDVLVQHIRIRVGDLGQHTDPGEVDGITVGAPGDAPVYNVVIDHCSVSWAIDEVVATWYPNTHDITFSNCIFAEGLNNSIHPQGPHSAGPLIGNGTKRVALLNNLLAHLSFRTPDLQGGTETLVVNNVIYDPTWLFIGVNNMDNIPDQPISTVIGNVCLKGPSSKGKLNKAVYVYSVGSETTLHVRDNLCDDLSESPLTSLEFKDPNTGQILDPINIVDEPPILCEHLTIRPSSETLEYVLTNAGARPWDRDRHDSRIVEQVRQRTGRIIDSQMDVGGW